MWLPAASLFAVPVADTRAPLSSVTLRWDDRFAIDATLAADFPVLRVTRGDLSVDAGIEAMVILGFQPNENLRFDLETVDGTFGLPVGLRWGLWTGRFEVAHTSAHFADGVTDDPEPPASSEGYSREWARLLAARQFGPARLYAGAKALLHDQRGLPPWSVQAGGEVAGPWKIAPFGAVDVQAAAENGWDPEVAAQVGVRAQVGGGRRLRVAATGRYGPDDTGKLQGQNEAWLGITFGFDSTGALDTPAGVDDAPR